MDYYDPTEQCVYYIHRTSGESSWEEPAGFREEADAAEPDEAEDGAVEEEEDAKETYEEAAVDDSAAKARVMFSYRKRPTAPWDPHGRTMRDPMFLTMMVALEIETFPSFASIKRHTARLQPEAELAGVQVLPARFIIGD